MKSVCLRSPTKSDGVGLPPWTPPIYKYKSICPCSLTRSTLRRGGRISEYCDRDPIQYKTLFPRQSLFPFTRSASHYHLTPKTICFSFFFSLLCLYLVCSFCLPHGPSTKCIATRSHFGTSILRKDSPPRIRLLSHDAAFSSSSNGAPLFDDAASIRASKRCVLGDV